MSRIGTKPVEIPEGVDVQLNGQDLKARAANVGGEVLCQVF